MQYSVDGMHTCKFGELVEGEAFMHGGTIWILCTIDSHTIDLDCANDKAHLLEVTHNGLIPQTVSLDDVSRWNVQPLEVTNVSFAPSMVSKEARQFM